MWKSSSVVGLAFCLSVGATTCMAASDSSGGNVGSQRMTGTQTGSAQVANPATGRSSTPTTSQANKAYSAPTGAPQPNATNPNSNQLSGGSKN
jgi:hypothetical protein